MPWPTLCVTVQNASNWSSTRSRCASDAAGTHYDGCLRLGEASYLFCNHLTRTMTEIRANPAWLTAQRPWAELAARFASDPLE